MKEVRGKGGRVKDKIREERKQTSLISEWNCLKLGQTSPAFSHRCFLYTLSSPSSCSCSSSYSPSFLHYGCRVIRLFPYPSDRYKCDYSCGRSVTKGQECGRKKLSMKIKTTVCCIHVSSPPSASFSHTTLVWSLLDRCKASRSHFARPQYATYGIVQPK